MTRRALLAAFTVAVLVPAAVRGQMMPSGTYGDVKVAAHLQPKEGGTHGYAEYGFTVTNSSGQQAHRVTLTLPARPSTGWGGGPTSGTSAAPSRSGRNRPCASRCSSRTRPPSPGTA